MTILFGGEGMSTFEKPKPEVLPISEPKGQGGKTTNIPSTEEITVKSIVEQWLKDHGYDGLCTDHCGCLVGDLMPCGDDGTLSIICRPGYKCRGKCRECEKYMDECEACGDENAWGVWTERV